MDHYESYEYIPSREWVAEPKGPWIFRRLWVLGIALFLYDFFFVIVPLASDPFSDVSTSLAGWLLVISAGCHLISFMEWWGRKNAESDGLLNEAAGEFTKQALTAYLVYKVTMGIARHLYRSITR